jgi:uncharacterized protein (DUF2062 family)
MAKKIIQRFMPNQESIKNHKSLQFLGDRLHEPNLWHLNRQSVAKAFAIGLFFAWVPLPTQMAMAAFAAIYFRANMAISVALVWVSNPLTMPPLYYGAYVLGLWVLQIPPSTEEIEFTLDTVLSGLGGIWEPFLIGCFIIGVICSFLGYFGIKALWRYTVSRQWQNRPHKHRKTKPK